jgi:hypothetical protein
MRLRSHIQRHLDAPARGGSYPAATVFVPFCRRNMLHNLRWQCIWFFFTLYGKGVSDGHLQHQ